MSGHSIRTTLLLCLACLAIGLAAGAIAWRFPGAIAEESTPEKKAEGKAGDLASGDGDGVTLLDAEKVAAAFRKGQMLLTTGEYKVMAGHRDKGGEPEVHAADTDVFYILDGEATFVTGGKVIDPRLESPGETRGARTEGGEARALKKGDVIVIPRGVPHWFRDVPRMVNYFVVKVTSPSKPNLGK